MAGETWARARLQAVASTINVRRGRNGEMLVTDPEDYAKARDLNLTLFINHDEHGGTCHSCHYKKADIISCESGVGKHAWCIKCINGRMETDVEKIKSGEILWVILGITNVARLF